MKKGFLKVILSALMAGVMAVSLAGCGNSTKSDKDKMNAVENLKQFGIIDVRSV